MSASERKIEQQAEMIYKLSNLNEEFFVVAKTAIEDLEKTGATLNPLLSKWIADVRKFDERMGVNAEVTVTPGLNVDAKFTFCDDCITRIGQAKEQGKTEQEINFVICAECRKKRREALIEVNG